MSAREEVLRRVRSALQDSAPALPVPRDYARAGTCPPGAPELVERFVDRLIDYKAGVHRTSAADLPATVAAAVAAGLARAARDLGGARPVAVVPSGLPVEWLAAADLDVRPGEALTALELDRVDLVLTACAVAVAETGTIVLDASPDQGPRALSLVPDVHVCVVRAAQLVASVPEAVARLTATRPLTWISGASATSDIEFNRVEGVHGPRTLEVVVVQAG